MISKSLLFLSTLVATACCACFDNGDKEIGGSCYKFVAQQLTFEDARNWCHYQNPVTSSYLAYVPNQFTSNFLASYARSAFGTNDGSFWIGLSRKTGGSWTWDSGNSVTYTNFGDQLGSNYVAESIVNAKWNTFGNNDKNFFVCGYDPAAPPTFAPLSPTPSGATGTTLPTTSPVPTTTECLPTTPTTFLFAYSNDFDPEVVTGSWNYLRFYPNPLYSHFANIRFDLRNPEDIQYHTDFQEANASVYTHLPYPSLGFPSPDYSSDILTILEKFLSNTIAPICGSRILILLKRLPNENYTSTLIENLQRNHVSMDVITSITPSGGLYHQTMYEIATRTNGICGFEPDHLIYLLTTYFDNVDMPYTVHSVNVPVSGNGSISLPSFTPSCTYDCIFWPTMTIQDHGPLDTYRATKLTLKNILHNDTHYVGDDSDIAYETIRLNDAYLLPNISYEITLDYEYSNSQTQILQIRIFSQSSIDYWLPYD